MDESERRVRAAAEAAEWWLLFQPGEMSHSQREQYVRWLRESPIHVEEMLRVAQVYNELSRFDRWDDIGTEGSTEETVVDFASYPSNLSSSAPAQLRAGTTLQDGGEGGGRPSLAGKRTYLPPKWKVAIAASVLLMAASLWMALPYFRGQIIATERGERREVVLADGSVLQVDPETTMSVRLGEDRREIVLQRGRALFRVARDPTRPFTVQADDTFVRAVGTAFAVEREQQSVTVTVAEGRVAISAPSLRVAPNSTKPSSGSNTSRSDHEAGAGTKELTANEQFTVKASGNPQVVRQVDTRRELAWTEGRLDFNDETLESAIAQFNRYNGVQLRIDDPALRHRTVSGIFDASDPESFVAFIDTTIDIEIRRDERHEITIGSRR